MPKTSQQNKKKYTHTGTDCSHRTCGMCDHCKEPMKVRYITQKPRRVGENGTS